MPLQIGIVGLPNVGKSTLFNALCRNRSAQAANYAFCTVDPNVGVVEVPDGRLSEIAKIMKPDKVVPATIEFVDIAGLVKGASRGEGLGNRFLSRIREVDAIVHVIRAFKDSNVMHVDGVVDPARDDDTIRMELMLADLQTLGKCGEKYEGKARTGDTDAKERFKVVGLIKETLEAGKMASEAGLTEEQKKTAKEFCLLTGKPILPVLNVDEDGLKNGDFPGVHICAKIEDELMDLPENEANDYLRELGVESSGLNKLIAEAYDALGLQTFFTAGPSECRAWTVRKGARAPEAAGRIHTDFERGFICAEIVAYDDFVECGGEAIARDKGKMRKEGKEYAMRDGDVAFFRFNV